MATPSDEMNTKLTWRRFEDGRTGGIPLRTRSSKRIPRTSARPMCTRRRRARAAAHRVRTSVAGWRSCVPGKACCRHGHGRVRIPPFDRRQPFPSMMGRVCPAPCQDGCNRNEVEDFVGINAVEQWIGDNAWPTATSSLPAQDTGKKVAVIGGGPAGMAAPTSCVAKAIRSRSSSRSRNLAA